MGATETKQGKGIEKGKRLPIKGEQNITELTAIARIKPGWYPKDRYRVEIRDRLIKEIKAKSPVPIPASVLTVLETFLNKLLQFYLDNPESVQGSGNLVSEVKNHSGLPSDIKNSFEKFIQNLIERFKSAPPREITWLDHLKKVLDEAHVDRQAEIRKMVTIHYARWVILDQNTLPGLDGPHILFTSNFDGPLEGYLEDFAAIDEGPLNMIFGHCIEWPGARPADGFIKYVRDHQISASVFYANYPRATVSQVNRALDWKSKTEDFIDRVQKMNGKTSEEWERITREYLQDLAKPTPSHVEFPKY